MEEELSTALVGAAPVGVGPGEVMGLCWLSVKLAGAVVLQHVEHVGRR